MKMTLDQRAKRATTRKNNKVKKDLPLFFSSDQTPPTVDTWKTTQEAEKQRLAAHDDKFAIWWQEFEARRTLDEERAQEGERDGARLFRARLAVLGHALHEDGAHHLVSRPGIREQLVEQVAVARVIPQVVMRVADGEFGFERVLDGRREPRGAIGSHGSSAR